MLPYFFQEGNYKKGETLVLDKKTSHHIVNVLRMKEDEQINLVNGNGWRFVCTIVEANKNKCRIAIEEAFFEERRKTQLAIAIGLTKNRNRNEWFLEKATEIGVDIIIPLICENSERDTIKEERMEHILIAAMMQSQQFYIPTIMHLQSPENCVADFSKENNWQVMVTHCMDEEKKSMLSQLEQEKNVLIFIGPEGDFTKKEIDQILSYNAITITLGPNRLRTETAAIYACTVFNQVNYGQ